MVKKNVGMGLARGVDHSAEVFIPIFDYIKCPTCLTGKLFVFGLGEGNRYKCEKCAELFNADDFQADTTYRDAATGISYPVVLKSSR